MRSTRPAIFYDAHPNPNQHGALSESRMLTTRTLSKSYREFKHHLAEKLTHAIIGAASESFIMTCPPTPG